MNKILSFFEKLLYRKPYDKITKILIISSIGLLSPNLVELISAKYLQLPQLSPIYPFFIIMMALLYNITCIKIKSDQDIKNNKHNSELINEQSDNLNHDRKKYESFLIFCDDEKFLSILDFIWNNDRYKYDQLDYLVDILREMEKTTFNFLINEVNESFLDFKDAFHNYRNFMSLNFFDKSGRLEHFRYLQPELNEELNINGGRDYDAFQKEFHILCKDLEDSYKKFITTAQKVLKIQFSIY